MEIRKKILEAQERLEKTLCCPSLLSRQSIMSLVEKQLLRTPFSGTKGEFKNLVERRANEVSNFLEMLRSASSDDTTVKSHGLSNTDWKLKQQTDQFRVMYREGPQGTPFHTMLCEGFADGPMDCCLCVSWESTLYEKWWPQQLIPTFKIISSSCLQKVRIGEEISIVRVKVPWPLSERETLLHNFELEYFEEDTVIILMNTIPDSESIDMSTHGFTKDGIPEVQETVRIDVVGGFILQKVSPNRSYFRAIVNMDMKLDFVPPWLINFVARQLIGNGYKLYTKAVAAVAAGDKMYRDALQKAMYTHIRERLYSEKIETMTEDTTTDHSSQDIVKDDAIENEIEDTAIDHSLQNTVNDDAHESEIEEEHGKHYPSSSGLNYAYAGTDVLTEQTHLIKDTVTIRPEVQHALGILDEAIAIIRNLQTADDALVKHRDGGNESQASDVMKQDDRKVGFDGVRFREELGDASPTKIVGHSQESAQQSLKLIPSDDDGKGMNKLSPNESSELFVMQKQPPALEKMNKVFDEVTVTVRGGGSRHENHGNGEPIRKKGSGRRKKPRFCGLKFS